MCIYVCVILPERCSSSSFPSPARVLWPACTLDPLLANCLKSCLQTPSPRRMSSLRSLVIPLQPRRQVEEISWLSSLKPLIGLECVCWLALPRQQKEKQVEKEAIELQQRRLQKRQTRRLTLKEQGATP